MAERKVIHNSGKTVAFYAPEKAYKGIESQLGLKIAKDTKGLNCDPRDGASGKLVRIRINFEKKGGSKLVFCDPSKIATIKKNLPGKSLGGKKIKSVGFPGG